MKIDIYKLVKNNNENNEINEIKEYLLDVDSEHKMFDIHLFYYLCFKDVKFYIKKVTSVEDFAKFLDHNDYLSSLSNYKELTSDFRRFESYIYFDDDFGLDSKESFVPGTTILKSSDSTALLDSLINLTNGDDLKFKDYFYKSLYNHDSAKLSDGNGGEKNVKK